MLSSWLDQCKIYKEVFVYFLKFSNDVVFIIICRRIACDIKRIYRKEKSSSIPSYRATVEIHPNDLLFDICYIYSNDLSVGSTAARSANLHYIAVVVVAVL